MELFLTGEAGWVGRGAAQRWQQREEGAAACRHSGGAWAAPERPLLSVCHVRVRLCTALTADLPASSRLVGPAPSLLGTALLLSHLLSRALAERPFATSDAPAWFEATARMVRGKLSEAAAGAPRDSLQAPAAIVAAVLGSGNPLAEVGWCGRLLGRGVVIRQGG